MAKAKEFTPDYAVHPGKTLEECMKAHGWAIGKLSDRLPLSYLQTRAILNGEKPITERIALALEKAFDVPASFWLSLQRNYDATLARLSKGDKERAC